MVSRVGSQLKMKLDKLEERVVTEGIFVSYKLTLVTIDCGHDREN